MPLKWGAQAAGLRYSTARRTPRLPASRLTVWRRVDLKLEVVAEPATPARGPRAVPTRCRGPVSVCFAGGSLAFTRHSMRSHFLAAVVAAIAWAWAARTTAAETSPPTLVQWHFLGAVQLAQDTNAARLRSVLAQPTTRAVFEQTIARLAAATGTNAAAAALTRPLFNDLLAAESFGEVRGGSGAPTQWLLAMRLPAEHGKRWASTWPALTGALGMAKGQAAYADGWLVGGVSASGEAPDLKPLRQRVAGAGKAGAWLEGVANLSGLARTFGWPTYVTWPEAHFAVVGGGQNVRATARLVFDHALDLPLEAWHIPTNTVREPLLSFTAIQGMRPWLAGRPVLTELSLPAPNQVFEWAQSQVPYQTHFAWAMPNADEHVRALQTKLLPAARAHVSWLNFGRLEYDTNRHRLSWLGFPVIVPFVNPAADAGFVEAGIFPILNPKATAPSELYAQILGRKELVYYDWELTQPRLADWQALQTLHGILAGYLPPLTNQVVLAWLQDTNVTRNLGNAVTEVTRAAPRELNAVRTSAVGLTAFEILQFARWVGGERFPHWTPPQSAAALRKARPHTNAPPARPNGPKPLRRATVPPVKR